MTYYVVSYEGPFGFIKPWTAVRDGETFSQPFLSPSTVRGMEIKLGVSGILRHRLSHAGIDRQQEQVQAAGWTTNRRAMTMTRQTGILIRGVMLRPRLHLAFPTAEDAEIAATDHLCLCRNEDLVVPVRVRYREKEGHKAVLESVRADTRPLVHEMTPEDFERIEGFELIEGKGPGTIPLGISRYTGEMMRGRLVTVGTAGGSDRSGR
ncbi:MAG: hypothetical protein AAFY55_15980 [Bacteroidota bacterium]